MNRRNVALRVAVALLAMGLIASACGSDKKSTSTSSGGGSTSGGSKTVNIAFVGALTGDAANLGINIRNGAKLAVDQANKKGGDIKFVLKEFDTKGDPAQATTVKDQFINDNSIIGLVGPAFSGETKAVLPSLQEAGLVMISASATNDKLPDVVPGQTVFHRAIADDSFQGKAIGKYLTETVKAKNIVVIDDNSEYGKGLADNVAGSIASPAKVAKRVTLDPKSQDFSAAVNDTKAAKPDGIMYAGYYQEAGRLKKQLTDAGVTAPFISGDGSLDPGFIQAAGASAAEGALLSCPCNLGTAESTGNLKTFYDAYKAAFNVDPGTYSPEAYDVANIYIQGAQKGNTTRAKMLNYIEKDFTSYDGVSKKIEFNPNGTLKTPQLFVFEVKGGKLTPKGT